MTTVRKGAAKIKSHKMLSIWLVFVVLSVAFFIADVNPTVKMDATVLGKLQGNGKHDRFYLVLRRADGKLDDRTVSAATYHQASVGDVYTFSYKQSQLDGSGMIYGWQLISVIILFFGVVTPISWWITKDYLT